MMNVIGNYIGKQHGLTASAISSAYLATVEADGGVVEAVNCLTERIQNLKTLGLWDRASAVWLPHGYKESKLYAVKGGANADLTITRAGTRTRKGPTYVEQVPYNKIVQSSNLGTSWTKERADDTLSLNSVADPDGNLVADTFTVGPTGAVSHRMYQSLAFSANAGYTFSICFKAGTYSYVGIGGTNGIVFKDGISPGLTVDLSTGQITGSSGSNVNAEIFDEGNGWYRVVFRAYGNTTDTAGPIGFAPNDVGHNAAFSGNGRSIHVCRAQFVQGIVEADYFNTTDRFNVPALDYTNDTCPALSLEPARTNLFTQSEDFSHVDWVRAGGPTTTANAIAGPDGLSTADKLTANASSTVFIQTRSIVVNTNYATSFYIKPDTHNFVYIRFTSGTAENFVSKVFDLSDGTLGETKLGTTSGTFVSASVEPQLDEEGDPTGWYRITLVCSLNITTGNVGWGFAGAKTGNTFNTSGTLTSGTFNGTQSVYACGAQLEAGSYATSYIPTTTATVSRIADAISAPVERTLVDNNEGTFYFEGSSFADSISKGILTISDGTTINRIMLSLSSTNLIALTITSGSVAVAAINTPFTSGTYYKVCMVYRNNYAALFVNGVKIGEDVSVSLPSTVNNFYVTKDQSGSSNFVGYIGGLLVSKTALTDAQAIAATL